MHHDITRTTRCSCITCAREESCELRAKLMVPLTRTYRCAGAQSQSAHLGTAQAKGKETCQAFGSRNARRQLLQGQPHGNNSINQLLIYKKKRTMCRENKAHTEATKEKEVWERRNVTEQNIRHAREQKTGSALLCTWIKMSPSFSTKRKHKVFWLAWMSTRKLSPTLVYHTLARDTSAMQARRQTMMGQTWDNRTNV